MTNQLMTADELLALPPDGRTELVEGKLVVQDPSYRHNRVAGTLYFALRRWTEGAPGRGEAGLGGNVRLDHVNLYCPDVWWVRDGRQPGVEDISRDDPPDLVVEVRSPGTWRHDIGRKRDNYERYGAAELWLVDTAANVVLGYRRSSPEVPQFDIELEWADGAMSTPLMVGLTIDVVELFNR